MQVIKYFFAVVLAIFALHAGAQIQQARGQFSLDYSKQAGLFDKKAPGAVKDQARLEASLKAVEAYFAEAGQSESANFDAIRGKILENPGRYILETALISEDDNTKDLRYSVVVRVSLNVANLRNAVQSGSAVGKASAGEKTPFSFVFISRQVDSTKSFDDRVYKRRDESAQLSASRQDSSHLQEKTSEGESIKGSRVNTDGSRSQQIDRGVKISNNSSATVETGGSTTRKASESTFRVIPSANLNQVFISKFSQAGYDVIEAAMVESEKFKVANIESDYKSGDDLQPTTLRAIAAGMKEAEVPYVALGTLDVGLTEPDPQTGLQRVAVTVNAKVWDVTKPIPRTLVAVGPVAYSGVGPTEEEARGNALKLAANNAAQELSSRMTEKGLH
jgi:hypothetical protein